MIKRVKFQELLESVTTNVYFQPPSTTTIKYPCIIYSRNNIDKLIVDTLKDIFSTTDVSINDSFFDLGGDSL